MWKPTPDLRLEVYVLPQLLLGAHQAARTTLAGTVWAMVAHPREHLHFFDSVPECHAAHQRGAPVYEFRRGAAARAATGLAERLRVDGATIHGRHNMS